MAKKFTSREISQIIFEEFEKGGWGDVDPSAFDPEILMDNPNDLEEDMIGLEEVVDGITFRINELIKQIDEKK